MDANTHRCRPGSKIRIESLETDGRKFRDDRDAVEAEFRELRTELVELQRKFYADNRFRLLIVFQAMDAGGKDGTIRKVFTGVNPQGVRVTSFKKPTAIELAHDFLWRIHQAVPGNGMIGIFNRSHYEDVLVVRVHDIVPKRIWEPRYDRINEFEQHLTESGTTVLKFFLHISKEEQKERFQDRLDFPEKNWKFDPGDLDKRRHWDGYMQAFEDMLTRCSTDVAPWHVIPSDRKWYRNYAVARVIVQALRDLPLRFPQPESDYSHIRIDD